MGRYIKNREKFLVFFIVAALAACGPQMPETQKDPVKEPPRSEQSAPEQSASYYDPDEGEAFDPRALMVQPVEEMESAQEKGKTILTLATMEFVKGSGVMNTLAYSFSNGNETCFIDLQPYLQGPEQLDAINRIAVEVATGKGPDIMDSFMFHADQEVLEKGVLLDLTPYLEECGITTEKYFPAYRSLVYDGKVYGVSPSILEYRMKIARKVLGSSEVPDLETLVDKLLAYPERASLCGWSYGSAILRYLLNGSENLWGMVDWESRKCDFSGELFSKILDVAKRYAEDGESGYEPILEMVLIAPDMEPQKVVEERDEVVFIDYYMDDGNFPHYSEEFSIMINANTKNPEAAFSFVSYALSKKGQNYNGGESVHKEFCEEKMQKYLEWSADERSALNMTPELVDEIMALYDHGRYYPKTNDKILKIVYEEAQSYFAGDRTKEEVIRIIQNRVQLYLNEDK